MITTLTVSNHKKAIHPKSTVCTIKFVSKTLTSIEITQGRWEKISNIRVRIGSRVVIRANGAHLVPIMHRVLLKTGITAGTITTKST